MTQELSIQVLPIDELVPYVRNARTHTPRQIKKLAKSIKSFGFINPIIIDEQKTIVAGHARVQAAKKIGLTQLPTIQVKHLSEAEKRAYILADNKIAENAGWDEHLLRIGLEFITQVA